ncbi:MAG: glycosyltransferase [Calditrichaeota bacterium]|nr:MAG: glycosyltransferase [Calditrichota bacterium]
MKLSVILPVYNAENTISSAINSILNQSFSDFELIVIDDGSTDRTQEIISSFSDERVKIIRQAHAGIVSALNNGLNSAAGDFVARMDADDISLPQRFEKQMALLESNCSLAAVGCGVAIFPQENVAEGMRYYVNWLNSIVTTTEIINNMYVEMPILHPTLIMRAEPLRQIGGYRKGDFPEDYDLLLRLYSAGGNFAKVPDVQFHWREHPDKLSRLNAAYRPAAFRELKLYFVIKNLLEKKRNFLFWGVGRDGKIHARSLKNQGYLPRAFIDISPKKIGQKYLNKPIIAPEDIPQNSELILCCVGTKGARAEIRHYLLEQAFVEGEHFWFLA